jgi:hypothetical protein
LVDTNARRDTFGQKIYRRLAKVVVRVTNDFEQLAQRNLSSLVHPSTAKDVRAELVQMSTRVGAKTYIRQNRAVTARGEPLRGRHICGVPPRQQEANGTSDAVGSSRYYQG